MIQNLQNIYSLSRKYFITFENKPALVSLVSLVATYVFEALYGVSMHERSDQVFNLLKTKQPLTEFPTVFRDAIIRGYLPLIGIDILTSFLETKLVSACKTAIVQDLNRRWLQEDTARALKNVNPELSQKVVQIIGEDSGKFAEKTIELFVERAMGCVLLVSRFYRVYNLSKSLHHGSAPFPLNYPGGLCALISGFTVIVCCVNFVFHRIIETSYNTARENSLLVTDRLDSFQANVEQISSMPHSNKANIVSYLQTIFNRALQTSGDLRMGQLAGEFTWMLPHAFELMIAYAGFLFMKADPEKLDYALTFLPLVKASLSFIKKFNGAVQGIINVLRGYACRINSVTELLEQFNRLDNLKSGINFEQGEKLEVYKLSVTGLEEKSLLKDVNFSLNLGQIYWLKGGSGTGKSVLLGTVMKDVSNQGEGTITTPQHVVRVSKMQFDPQPKTFSDLLKEKFGIENSDLIPKIKASLQKFPSYYQDQEKLWKIKALEDESRKHNWQTLSLGQVQVLNLIVILISIEDSYPNESVALLADEILSNLDIDINNNPELYATPSISNKTTPPNSPKKDKQAPKHSIKRGISKSVLQRVISVNLSINSTRQAAVDLLKDFVKDKKRVVLLIEHNKDGLELDSKFFIKTNENKFKIQQLKS